MNTSFSDILGIFSNAFGGIQRGIAAAYLAQYLSTTGTLLTSTTFSQEEFNRWLAVETKTPGAYSHTYIMDGLAELVTIGRVIKDNDGLTLTPSFANIVRQYASPQ